MKSEKVRMSLLLPFSLLLFTFAANAATAAEMPEGYTAVEWIESSGGAYIDTGYHPTLTTRIVADFNPLETESWGSFFGLTADDESRNGILMRYYGAEDKLNGWFCNDNYHEAQIGGVANNRIQVELKAGWLTVGGSSAEITTTGTPYDGSIYIFSVNHNGEPYRSHAMRLYSFTIYDTVGDGSEGKLRDFVPCVRKSDQAVGLYDLAESDPSEAFYANAGSGAFGGPDGVFCTVTVGALKNMTAAYTFGDGSVTNAVSGTFFAVLKGTSDVKVIFTAKQNYAIEGDSVVALEGSVTENVVFGEGNDYAVPKVVCVLGDVTYLDWDEENGTMTNATLAGWVYELVTSDTRTFENGKWYVVADNIEINDGGNIKVNGSAHLILCDNASLTVGSVGDYKAAIDVSASGLTTNSLTIYGQESGSGKLTATGGHDGAGIGGGDDGAGGTVTINGGMVTATGGGYGAGIGGGDDGAGGTVTINGISPERSESPIGDGYQGCTVTATGGKWGAGIGGGSYGNGGTVTINGGTVTATGGDEGAGIGGGLQGAGGTVTINGGTVTATGGDFGAGIGGGYNCAGGEVVIRNGAVKVIAGMDASVIGHGKYSSNDGTVSISGGIFGMFVAGGWCAEGYGVFQNPDPASAADYPWTVELFVAVTLEGLSEHATAAYTFGDGSVTNAVEGTNFKVVWGTENFKVIFTPEHNYQFVDAHETGERELDSPLVKSCTVTPPEVEAIPGTDAAPWPVGKNVTAYVSDEGVLVIGGTGAMDDFASAADVPWNPALVTAVTVANGVTLGKNALAGFADTVTVNGLTISSFMLAVGGSEPVIPEGKVLVSKEEIAAAKAETVTVDGGAVTLGVTVNTNGDLTAETKSWQPVELNGGNVKVENGKIVITIPVDSESGFMILQSGDAKIAPAN